MIAWHICDNFLSVKFIKKTNSKYTSKTHLDTQTTNLNSDTIFIAPLSHYLFLKNYCMYVNKTYINQKL